VSDYIKFAFMCKERPPSNNLKVAVIGAGPAGLAAAGYLSWPRLRDNNLR